MYGPRYGRYTPWDTNAAHRLEIVGFPRGRLIIEAQAVIMVFLRHMVEKLSQDSRGAKVSTTTQLPPPLKNTDGNDYWSEIARQPFAAPAAVDLEAMIALAKGKMDAANDHWWLLQTEPSYLRQHLLSINQTKSAQSTQGAEMRSRIAFWEFSHEYDVHMFWHGALLELEHLRTVYERFGALIVPGSPLPGPVEEALAAVEALLVVNAQTKCFRMRTSTLPERPQFQHLYKHCQVRSVSNGLYEPSTELTEAIRMATEHGAESFKLFPQREALVDN